MVWWADEVEQRVARGAAKNGPELWGVTMRECELYSN